MCNHFFLNSIFFNLKKINFLLFNYVSFIKKYAQTENCFVFSLADDSLLKKLRHFFASYSCIYPYSILINRTLRSLIAPVRGDTNDLALNIYRGHSFRTFIILKSRQRCVKKRAFKIKS